MTATSDDTTESPQPDFVVSALGTTVGIRWVGGAPAEVLASELRTWSRCRPTDEELEHEADFEVTVGVRGALGDVPEEQVNAVGADVVEALEVATAAVTICAIENIAGERLMLHACAVADPDTGDAVVLVGPSGAGKTTIAGTLGKRWAYVTDETVAIDVDGVALAYPKPLCVVDGDRKILHSPDDLGLVASPAEVTVAKVFLLDRRPGLEAAEVEPVATADAIALLAEHTSYLTRLDEPLQWLGGLVQVTGGVDRVRYGECVQLEPVLEALLGGAR